MQKLIFSLFFCAGLMMTAQAQIQTPSPSPLAKVSQAVGLINIDIEYSRPSLKGRKAFGSLVPFGEVWRTGANQAVKLTFGGEVSIAGSTLKKGDYTILTTPGEKEWKVAFYSYVDGNWGGYVEKTAAATLMVPVIKTSNSVETFTIGIDDIRNDAAALFISWENTLVKVPVQLPTDKAVMANIDRVMGGPSGGDYMAAARYYWESGKDLNKAIEWMNKGLEKDGERFWTLRQKSLIQADLKDYKGAIATAQKSLALAKEAKNNDYIKMNEESIAMWMKK